MDNTVTKLPVSRHAAETIDGQYAFGDVVSHEELDRLLEIERPPGRMTAAEHDALKWRFLGEMDALTTTLLVEHQILLRNIRGQGYILIQPSEQTAVALADLHAQIGRALKKGANRLAFIRLDLMTEEERQRNVAARAHVSALRDMQQRERRLLKKPAPVLTEAG